MSETTVMRVGIVGFGAVGKKRFSCLIDRSDVSVVWVCDRTLTDADGRINSIPTFSDPNDINVDSVDVVFICLPNFYAAEETKRFLSAGKHVFCEKPPGRTVNDVQQMIELERNNPGIKLMFGFNHRYHRSVQEALKLFQLGKIGELVCLRGFYGKSNVITFGQDDWRTRHMEAGGGILLDQGIHMVDLIRLFSGDFYDVKSYVQNTFWNFEVEDNVHAIMQTEDGVIATLNSSATQWQHTFNLEIVGSLGTFSLQGLLTSSKSYGQETLTVYENMCDGKGRPVETVYKYEDDPSWQEEVDSFLDYVKYDKNVVMGSSYDALKTMELIFRIYDSDPSWKSHREALIRKYRC